MSTRRPRRAARAPEPLIAVDIGNSETTVGRVMASRPRRNHA